MPIDSTRRTLPGYVRFTLDSGWQFHNSTFAATQRLDYRNMEGYRYNSATGLVDVTSYFQIWRQEQVLDILRNTTTNPPDRVKEFTFKGSGGTYSKLFDGTEKTLSWDNILWVNRTISVP